MRIFADAKGSINIGSGKLYAIEAEDYATAIDDTAKSVDVSAMTEIGCITGSATLTRTSTSSDIVSANYGKRVTYKHDYVTEFDTDVISYIPANVARFMTGSDTETITDGIITYFGEDDQSPDVTLVFVADDDKTGKKFTIVMPKANWIGDYTLDFNNDNPIALDFHFGCANVTLPNGKVGSAWVINSADEEEEEEETTPSNP